ncbi:nuclear transport factor 2 family protein [Actinomadura sp. NAK00032]|uniref:nuclear transport factor 2 family protein n=1 Tax=Actinomadura sp. NAK00032 TaxID=2742128 RepID=UPI001591DA17|nr:nuclear transport factor 2 family protein [Actinomadura sp. NAK00032]QKW38179.1 nuclear transport factor 2 family protein [Actinomadura sp. NAK00032]
MTTAIKPMPPRLRRLLVASVTVAFALAPAAGCGDADAPAAAGPSSTSAPPPREGAVPGLLRPVRAYVDAVAGKDLDALAGAFARDAVLIDVGRRFNGRDAIRAWADAEVIGGTLTVSEIVENRPGHQRLLVRFAPGGTGGFAAHYAFTVSGPVITRAELTYAD